MEGLFTHELTASEYGEIIHHCLQQLDRLGYYIREDLKDWKPEKKTFTEKDLHELLKPLREALCPSLEYERDETSRIMEEDRD